MLSVLLASPHKVWQTSPMALSKILFLVSACNGATAKASKPGLIPAKALIWVDNGVVCGRMDTKLFEELLHLLRGHSRILYITVLKAPPEARLRAAAALTLYGELASIQIKVSEPLLAHIRLAWWRDQVALPLSQRVNNPVLAAIDGNLFNMLSDAVEALVEQQLSPVAAGQRLLGVTFRTLAKPGDEDAAAVFGAALQCAPLLGRDPEVMGLVKKALDNPPKGWLATSMPWLRAAQRGKTVSHHVVPLGALCRMVL